MCIINVLKFLESTLFSGDFLRIEPLREIFCHSSGLHSVSRKKLVDFDRKIRKLLARKPKNALTYIQRALAHLRRVTKVLF